MNTTICIVLHVICYLLCIYIYVLHMWVWDQTREVCSVQRVVLEWEDFKVIWAMQSPLSLSLYLDLRCTQRCYCKTAVGPCKKGVQPATIKRACSPLSSTPTALKQHRDQSIRPVPLSDSDYSDIYQWTVIHIKVTVKVISDTYTLHSVSSVCLVHYQVIVSIISEVN